MEEEKWYNFYYNGNETNIQVNKFGNVKRIYNPNFTKNNSNSKIGIVNTNDLVKSKKGYYVLRVRIKNLKSKTVFIHQIVASVFLKYEFGNFPNQVVDHIDNVKTNNSLDNLQVITNRENCVKDKIKKSLLPVGVFYRKDTGKFQSYISLNGKRICLGSFGTSKEASYAYNKKLKEIKQNKQWK